MNAKALLIAVVTGTVLQFALVVAGHFVPTIADNLFALGGAAISFAAGLIYVRKAPGTARPLLGGAAAGAICAFLGILLSVVLGDVPAIMLLLGTLAAAGAGTGGAALGPALAARKPRA